jgi:hypothetical protein
VKKQTYFAALLLLATACGDSSRPAVSETDSVRDSAVAPAGPIAGSLGGDTIEPTDVALVIYRFGKNLALLKEDTLTAAEVRKRFMPVDSTCGYEANFTLARFFYLDSCRQNKVDPQNEIGSIISVQVRFVDSLKLASCIAVAWTMRYESYPACPASSGTYFLLTTYKNGKIVSTQLMGKDESSADAPVFLTTFSESVLYKDGSFKGIAIDTSGEYVEESDKPVIEVSKNISRGKILSDGKIVFEAKKE